MKSFQLKSTIVLGLIAFLTHPVFADAPVVDSSENYSILNQQSDANEDTQREDSSEAQVEPDTAKQPQTDTNENDEESVPLVHTDDSHELQSELSLLNKVQSLQQDVQDLRGQLEVQAHDLKLLQQQQLAFYKDLDTRVHNIAESPQSDEKKESIQTTQPTKPAVNPANEQLSYLAAYELIKNKQFDEAMAAMQTFIEQYPRGGYTANAQYWLGELYLQKQDYPEAMSHFELVVKNYPTSSKAAASRLKLGFALADSGKKSEAIQELEELIKQHPDTNPAQLAKDKLNQLRST